jgi:threonylcarbamoyladenosine tRNA methylthiotransferase MtaB
VGCYAQLKPEELAAVDGVDLVLGATENLKLPIISMICLK